jgi:hypothetical protein
MLSCLLQGSSTWLVNISSFSGGMNEWSNSQSQRSRPVLLAAGESLLLEAVHCQSPSGPSRLQVMTINQLGFTLDAPHNMMMVQAWQGVMQCHMLCCRQGCLAGIA